jgi:hypothetical protein
MCSLFRKAKRYARSPAHNQKVTRAGEGGVGLI